MIRQGGRLQVARLMAELRVARWLWMPVLVFAVTRVGIMLVAYFGEPIIADNPVTPPYHLRAGANPIVDTLGSRWDTGFYVSIVEEGYKDEGVRFPSVAFFPLMPMAMRGLVPVVRDAVVAGLIVSNCALLVATVLLYRLVDIEWGESIADRAVWYFLAFPASLFGSAIYSESLFLAVSIGSLYLARSDHWVWAGALGAVACLGRLLGLLMVPLLVLEWWMRRRVRDHSPGRPGLLGLFAVMLAPVGTLAYMAYLEVKFDDPLAFIHASEAWGRELRSPIELLGQSFPRPEEGWLSGFVAGHVHLDNLLDLSFVVLFISLGAALLFQRRWGEGAFVTMGTVAPLSSGLLMSQRRYVWVLFPAFVLLARWGVRPWVDRLVTGLSLTLLALFTALFANGYWVA